LEPIIGSTEKKSTNVKDIHMVGMLFELLLENVNGVGIESIIPFQEQIENLVLGNHLMILVRMIV
jgi:hypothetical protein